MYHYGFTKDLFLVALSWKGRESTFLRSLSLAFLKGYSRDEKQNICFLKSHLLLPSHACALPHATSKGTAFGRRSTFVIGLPNDSFSL